MKNWLNKKTVASWDAAEFGSILSTYLSVNINLGKQPTFKQLFLSVLIKEDI